VTALEDVIEDFRRTVEEAAARLLSLTEVEAAAHPAEGKWSAKETIGHLIDSATNNHQRFVRARFQKEFVFPGYAQEDWVRVQAYDKASWPLLVNLWRFYNLYLAHLMSHTPEGERLREWSRHNLHEIGFAPVSADEPATLEHLMRDYVAHLKHHLQQLLGE
jgi:hypothetical protein